MGLYSKIAMAAILDMQISKFSKQHNQPKRVQKKYHENQMNIDDWRAFVYFDLEYANESITAILDMQIS